MSLQKIAIIGAGGFGREVLDVFDAFNLVKPTYHVIGYIVDPQFSKPGTIINGKPILGGFEWFKKNKNIKAICGIGEPSNKMKAIMRAKELGVDFCSIIHPKAILTQWVTIGEGCVITAGCILTNQIRIGNHVQINLDCTIGHDVHIENYVTLAPGVHVSGNVTLHEGCYVGTGANIIEKRTIGSWSIVGAGSTIIINVPNNSSVVGTPGRVIKTRDDKWQLK